MGLAFGLSVQVRAMIQGKCAPALGAGGRRFKSCRPDSKLQVVSGILTGGFKGGKLSLASRWSR
jgi:hypothetical protein